MSANNYKTNHERMLELIAIINEADIAYYRDDRPGIRPHTGRTERTGT